MELHQWLQKQPIPPVVQMLISDHIKYVLGDLHFITFMNVVEGKISFGEDGLYWFAVMLDVTYLDEQHNVQKARRWVQHGCLELLYRVEIPHYSGAKIFLWIPPSRMHRFHEFVQIVQMKLREQLKTPHPFVYRLQYEDQFVWRWD